MWRGVGFIGLWCEKKYDVVVDTGDELWDNTQA